MQVTFLKIYTWALSRNITLKRVLWFDKFSKSRIIFYSWWQSMYISVSGLFRILKWGKLFNFVDQSIFQTSGKIFSQRNGPEACPKWAVWKINPKEFMADAAKHSRVFRLCKYLVKATPQVPSSSWKTVLWLVMMFCLAWKSSFRSLKIRVGVSKPLTS